MRIVTWNCNGALRRKLREADSLDADVLVVQECENPASSTSEYRDWAGNYIWTGELKSKGIGIFARRGQAIEALAWDSAGTSLFLPARIDGSIDILGVWTQKTQPAALSYIGQLWHYLQANSSHLSKQTVICGDFNSNAIWDRPRREWNHSDCVRFLHEMGFDSLYHLATGEVQGRESTNTFFLYRHREKAYHIDYVFAHKATFNAEHFSVELGNPDEWLAHSDHLPIIVEL